jgi:glycosyltransferase involved in cell wall biosynthesis
VPTLEKNSRQSGGAGRLRLLFLVPHVPGLRAATGGARSTAHLIEGLSRHHDIAVLCLRRPHDPPADPSVVDGCCRYEEVEQVVDRSMPSGSRRTGPLRDARLLMFGEPRWVAQTDVPSFRRRVRAVSLEWRPDIVHIAYHLMGQYAADLRGQAPRVLTEYDPGITAARDAVRESRGFARMRALLEITAWARYERRVIGHMNRVVVFTEDDRRAIAPLAGRVPIVRIPLGTTIPAAPLSPSGRDQSVLFVGNFVHPPNVEAALRLMRTIFPEVYRARPQTRLVIAGADPPEEIRRMAGGPITVTGTVESMTPLLDAAAVVVAPIRHGGGMRVKLLDALAAGKATVASAVAAAGLDVKDGHQLLLADRDAEFAAAIVRLVDDPPARAALAERARAWACTHAGWDRSIARYEALQLELLERKDETIERAELSSGLLGIFKWS